MAEHRIRRKQAGLVQATIWLPQDVNAKLKDFMVENNIGTKSEAVQTALQQILTKDGNETRA
jgi:metal-responsive CopG/Arc/MetJ family transcriptional regulator